MNTKQLSDYSKSLCGNYYVSLDDRPDLIDTVMNHTEYSHCAHNHRYSISIYFHCEGSPTGVIAFASIDVSKKDILIGKMDAITRALYCF